MSVYCCARASREAEYFSTVALKSAIACSRTLPLQHFRQLRALRAAWVIAFALRLPLQRVIYQDFFAACAILAFQSLEYINQGVIFFFNSTEAFRSEVLVLKCLQYCHMVVQVY